MNPIAENIAMAQAMAEEAASYRTTHALWVSFARMPPKRPESARAAE